MMNDEFDIEKKDFWDLLEYKIGLLQVCREIDRNTLKERDQKTTSNQDNYRYAKQLYGHINILENVIKMIDIEIKKRLMKLSDDGLYSHFNIVVSKLEEARKEIEENNNRSVSARMLFYPLKASTLEAYEDLYDCFLMVYNSRNNVSRK